MNKILIVSNLLRIGGAEKLLYEVVGFARANNLEPVILILDSYDREHYDPIYEQMNVKVVRTRISLIKNFRSPMQMLQSVIWIIRLRYFARKLYKSIHVIGLYNLDKVYHGINHNRRFFWNVNNAIQFVDRKFPYSAEYFGNGNDTIVCINKYQATEMQSQYGLDLLKAKITVFKLFLGGHDTN
ncbi:glycosyltransferase family protein [Mucilaginibacter gilvus]|uniref:Glycosyltransferase subfamily 4-like N-terminal domain-containing protein n=1 Tax=Mucilaginibacter gilvus TaxID=2305909 RepID=A0A444MUL0_9SPHI|nr:hypothetical protein [Mucilaginibacter gilvus]RWY57324.1 hypothetical protein EPL05_01970 [Mucilaginibacter gilvus]